MVAPFIDQKEYESAVLSKSLQSLLEFNYVWFCILSDRFKAERVSNLCPRVDTDHKGLVLVDKS